MDSILVSHLVDIVLAHYVTRPSGDKDFSPTDVLAYANWFETIGLTLIIFLGPGS